MKTRFLDCFLPCAVLLFAIPYSAAVTSSPASLTFAATEGIAPATQTLNISGSSGAIVQASATTASGSWLSVSPGFVLSPGAVVVSANSQNLVAGSYQGTVALQTGGVTTTVAVNLTVNPAAAGQLTLIPTSLVATTAATLGPRYLLVGVSGSGSVNFTAVGTTFNGQNWLSVSPPSGTATLHAPIAIQVAFNTSTLPPSVYTGQVTVTPTGGGTPLIATIHLMVPSVGSAVMVLNQTGITFNVAAGAGITPAPMIVGNAGTGTMQWLASVFSNWLTLSSNTQGVTTGQSSLGSTLQVTANSTSFAPGTYYGLITVAAATPSSVDAPQYVTAVLNVGSASSIGGSVYPRGLLLTAVSGGSSQPQTVNVTSAAAAGAKVTVSSQVPGTGPNWVTVNSGGGSSYSSSASLTAQPTTQLNVVANAASLSPGVYYGTATATFLDGSPAQDINAALLVTAGSTSCTASNLVVVMRQPGPNFSYTIGWPAPMEAQVIDDCGQPVYQASVVVSFNDGDAPMSLTSAGGGIYAGMWKPTGTGAVGFTVRASEAGVNPSTIVMNGSVAAAPAGMPSVNLGGVVNGASFLPAANLAPGSIVSVFGTNLATSNTSNSGFPLPTTLGGIKLTIGGVDAPLFYGSKGQVNAQLPFEIPPGWQTQMIARATGTGSEMDAVPEVITVGIARPGIFIAAESGAASQGAILNAASQMVDAAHPASAGAVIVIFATGMGATTPALATGQQGVSNSVNAPVAVTIGGIAAPNVQYAGSATGFVGLYQVNVVIPPGVATGGAVPVVLTQNGIVSNMATIAIQ
jgi:uncharacterized protein (TIGR03437 family)